MTSYKVFIIPNNVLFPTVSSDTTEHLLYDYNWQVGDIVPVSVPGTISGYSWVSAIDSVDISGTWHKRWSFLGRDTFYMSLTNYDTFIHYSVIEGIGCLNGFFYPLATIYISSGVCNYVGSASEEVVCFSSHGTKPAISLATTTYGVESDHTFDNNASCSLRVKDIAHEPGTAQIAPDPITDESKIIFPETIKAGRICITNMLGQIVWQKEITNANEMVFGTYIPARGLYAYALTDNTSGKTCYGKFVR